MAYELDHDGARRLAKALTARTGREIKLKDIYEDIGSIFGMKGDAMMHALKNATPTKTSFMVGSEHFDETVGLHTLPYFLDQMERGMVDHAKWEVLFCVVHVGSVETVRNRFGDEAALDHVKTFAKLMHDRPYTRFADCIHAYLGESFFLVGWPRLDFSDEHASRVNTKLRGWRLDLDKSLADRGLGSEHAYEFGASGFVTDNGSYDRLRAETKIGTCRTKAVNLVKARRELSAFPLVRLW